MYHTLVTDAVCCSCFSGVSIPALLCPATGDMPRFLYTTDVPSLYHIMFRPIVRKVLLTYGCVPPVAPKQLKPCWVTSSTPQMVMTTYMNALHVRKMCISRKPYCHCQMHISVKKHLMHSNCYEGLIGTEMTQYCAHFPLRDCTADSIATLVLCRDVQMNLQYFFYKLSNSIFQLLQFWSWGYYPIENCHALN